MSFNLERLLEIDALLRSKQRHTAESLASALEVSERTIRGDLAYLRDRYHAPLEFNRTQGHYYSDPEWRLPSITLSQGELFALTLGARMLEAYAGSAYATDLRSAISRLAERLPEQSQISQQFVQSDKLSIQMPQGVEHETLRTMSFCAISLLTYDTVRCFFKHIVLRVSILDDKNFSSYTGANLASGDFCVDEIGLLKLRVRQLQEAVDWLQAQIDSVNLEVNRTVSSVV